MHEERVKCRLLNQHCESQCEPRARQLLQRYIAVLRMLANWKHVDTAECPWAEGVLLSYVEQT